MLEVIAQTESRASRGAAYDILRDPRTLPGFEGKVSLVKLSWRTDGGAGGLVLGVFGLVPYWLRVRWRFHDGLGSDAATLPGSFLPVAGAFRLGDTPRGCRITHVETYDFGEGVVARVLEAACAPYLEWTMRREVERLAAAAERRERREPAALRWTRTTVRQRARMTSTQMS